MQSNPTERSQSMSTEPSLKLRLEEELARLEKEDDQASEDIKKKQTELGKARAELTTLRIDYCMKEMEIDVLKRKLATSEKTAAELGLEVAKQERVVKRATYQHSKIHDEEISITDGMIDRLGKFIVPREMALGDIASDKEETEKKHASIADELSKCTAEMADLSVEYEKTQAALKEIPFHDIEPEVTKAVGDSIGESVKSIRRTVINLRLKNRDLETQV